MKQDKKSAAIAPVKIPSFRLICGFVVLILSVITPFFIPLILLLPLSVAAKTLISGVLLFGVPEVGILLAIVILGNEGFIYLKSRLFFWLKQTASTTKISRTRFHIGITMFSIALILGFLIPYLYVFLPLSMQQYPSRYTLILDIFFLISVFILGGNFWNKLRSLFIYD